MTAYREIELSSFLFCKDTKPSFHFQIKTNLKQGVSFRLRLIVAFSYI